MSSAIADAVRSATRSFQPGAAVLRPPEWTKDANCDGAYDETSDALLHPHGEPSAKKMQKVNAAFCGGCTVKSQCLALGLETGSKGIWGGQYLPGSSRVRDRAEREEVAERVLRGETDATIARMTGLHLTTVAQWRRDASLECNREYGSGISANDYKGERTA